MRHGLTLLYGDIPPLAAADAGYIPYLIGDKHERMSPRTAWQAAAFHFYNVKK
jgi:hypothetical protein